MCWRDGPRQVPDAWKRVLNRWSVADGFGNLSLTLVEVIEVPEFQGRRATFRAQGRVENFTKPIPTRLMERTSRETVPAGTRSTTTPFVREAWSQMPTSGKATGTSLPSRMD